MLKCLLPYLPSDLGTYYDADKGDGDENAFYKKVKFFYFCGVVPTSKLYRLRKLIFRLSRGNAFLHSNDLIYENTNNTLNFKQGGKKSVFFLVFQVSQSNMLKIRFKKALNSVDAVCYKIPNNLEAIEKLMGELEKGSY
jgi:hypothetical protein